MTNITLYTEAAYKVALEGIAQGATKHEIIGTIERSYGALTKNEVSGIVAEALGGALSSGVEREDVDPSLFQ